MFGVSKLGTINKNSGKIILAGLSKQITGINNQFRAEKEYDTRAIISSSEISYGLKWPVQVI